MIIKPISKLSHHHGPPPVDNFCGISPYCYRRFGRCFFRYVTKTIEQYASSDYTLVYFHWGLTSRNKPSFPWLARAYQTFDRRWDWRRLVFLELDEALWYYFFFHNHTKSYRIVGLLSCHERLLFSLYQFLHASGFCFRVCMPPASLALFFFCFSRDFKRNSTLFSHCGKLKQLPLVYLFDLFSSKKNLKSLIIVYPTRTVCVLWNLFSAFIR